MTNKILKTMLFESYAYFQPMVGRYRTVEIPSFRGTAPSMFDFAVVPSTSQGNSIASTEHNEPQEKSEILHREDVKRSDCRYSHWTSWYL